MPGDDKSEPPPPPPTMEGLAAMMTKLLSSMGDMETRFTSMESRITSMESRLQPPPTSNPAASMPYGMPGYGSTTLASSSSTAAATLSTAPPTSSPTLPITKDLCPDIRVTIVQIQAALQEMIQLERKRGGRAPTSGNAQVLGATARPRDAQGATGPSGFIHPGGSAAAGCNTPSPGAETATGDAPEDARGSLDGG